MAATGAARDRVRELETLRGVAIAAVVVIHVTWQYAAGAGLDRPAGRFAAAFHLLGGFGVPLFLALSAAGLTLGYQGGMSVAEYVSFLGRRALRLLPAYVVWSLISIAVVKPHELGSAAVIASELLHGRADAQFYYIPLVFELYVLWPIFQPLARVSARSKPVALATAIGGLAISVWWWHFSVSKPRLQGTELSIVFWLLYVCLGIAVANRTRSIRALAQRGVVIAVVSSITAFAAYFMYENFIGHVERARYDRQGVFFASTIFQLPPTAYIYLAMFTAALVVFRYRRSLDPFLLMLARNSYGIYLIHYLVLRLVVHRLVPPASLATASTAAVAGTITLGWLACIAISVAVVAAGSRSAALRPFVSNRW